MNGTPIRMWTADKMPDPGREGNRLPPLRRAPVQDVPRRAWWRLLSWR